MTIRPTLNEGTHTYGYVSSDSELARVYTLTHRPDYILFVNGDTFYANEMFEKAKPLLLFGMDLVGMNWQPTVRVERGVVTGVNGEGDQRW